MEHKIVSDLRKSLRAAFLGQDWAEACQGLIAKASADLMQDPSASVLDVLSLPDVLAEERVKRATAAWDHCAGIDTDRLWPGAMGEMVEALEMADGFFRRVGYDARSPTVKSIRAILAKLGKV